MLLWVSAASVAGLVIAWPEVAQRMHMRDLRNRCAELEHITTAQGAVLTRHADMFERSARPYAWSREPADANPLSGGEPSSKEKPFEPLRLSRMRRMTREDG
jgi:hypothetical protein